MSKHRQNSLPRAQATVAVRETASPLAAPDWSALEECNALESPKRAERLKQLGFVITDPAVLGILTKSHFVIPGKTRFQCQRCGECCRYARKVAQLTYDPCQFLTGLNTCAKHDERYLVCKWFPFWTYHDPRFGALLTIKPYCTGQGKGPVVDYQATLEQIRRLAVTDSREDDGAFVIHEVLYIPGRGDWAFPSKGNVDALLSFIDRESKKSALSRSSIQPLERPGEVHYAHHYTSGLLGSINSPLFTVNEQGVVTDANGAACELLRRELADVMSKPFASFFVNPDRVSASLGACLAHGRETAAPQRLRLSDDITLPVLLNGLVYRSRNDGLVHGSLLCVNPVSAAVYSEVSQSRNYARGLLEACLDALLVIDKDGVVVDVNGAAVEMTGHRREDLTGHAFCELFVDREKARQGVESTFRDGTIRMLELTLVDTQGELIPVSLNATVYRDEDGVVQGVLASARDVRERLKMVREVQEAHNYARGLIECCLDLMVTINREGIITDVNMAATHLTGMPREKLIAAPFAGFFDDPVRARQGVAQTFDTGEVRDYGLNLLAASGQRIPVSFNATLYRDSAGAVQGIFAVARFKAFSPSRGVWRKARQSPHEKASHHGRTPSLR